jgi:PadR family transcriptional regulator, regulatory protein PadR
VSNRELVQGTLEMLVLKTLALESMHGYGIAFRIEQVSACVFRVNPGSLLPALSRMERAGRIRGNGARRKTTAGHKALEQECRQWGRQIAAIERILEA